MDEIFGMKLASGNGYEIWNLDCREVLYTRFTDNTSKGSGISWIRFSEMQEGIATVTWIHIAENNCVNRWQYNSRL
jgi:hypothetical protein